MIKTEKVQTSDLAKARKAFLNLETEKASLVKKLAKMVFEVFKSASYNPNKNAKTDIGNYDFDSIDLLYSFRKEKVEIIKTTKRYKGIINNYSRQFYFDDYLLVGTLNLSRKKGSALATECFELSKRKLHFPLNDDDFKMFLKFSEDYLLKDVLNIASVFFTSFKEKEPHTNNYWELRNGLYPVRFIDDIGEFALSLSSDTMIHQYSNGNSNESFESLFLKDNNFFSTYQIAKIHDYMDSVVAVSENSDNLVEVFRELSKLVQSGFFKIEDFVSKFNEKVETDFDKVFTDLYQENDASFCNTITAQKLNELSDESLLLLFKNFMKLRYKSVRLPSKKNFGRKNFETEINATLKIIDDRELKITKSYPIDFNDFNSSTFLSSECIKSLDKVYLEVAPEFIVKLIEEVSKHNPNSFYNTSAFHHSFFAFGHKKINSNDYLFDIIEERLFAGTEFFISKDFYENLGKLVEAIDSGLVLSSSGKIELELKRILKLFKPI